MNSGIKILGSTLFLLALNGPTYAVGAETSYDVTATYASMAVGTVTPAGLKAAFGNNPNILEAYNFDPAGKYLSVVNFAGSKALQFFNPANHDGQ